MTISEILYIPTPEFPKAGYVSHNKNHPRMTIEIEATSEGVDCLPLHNIPHSILWHLLLVLTRVGLKGCPSGGTCPRVAGAKGKKIVDRTQYNHCQLKSRKLGHTTLSALVQGSSFVLVSYCQVVQGSHSEEVGHGWTLLTKMAEVTIIIFRISTD